MYCHKCNKKISFLTGKGFDIKGNLLCGDCWNQSVDDVERHLMYKITSQEQYNDLKEQLKAQYQKLRKKSIQEVSKDTEDTWAKAGISCAVISILIPIFALLGIICGCVAMYKGKVGKGLSVIILNIIFGYIGTIILSIILVKHLFSIFS